MYIIAASIAFADLLSETADVHVTITRPGGSPFEYFAEIEHISLMSYSSRQKWCPESEAGLF
jgi:hypothetical protein